MFKQKLASFLTEAAREGISKLDKDSPAARELSTLDVDVVLKEDIHQICEAITFPEIMRVLSLGATIKLGSGDTQRAKDDIKKMALVIEDRITQRQGKLRLPSSCRDLLFNL